MKVAIGSDHGAVRLKEELKQLMEEMGVAYEDVGTHSEASVDYPDIAVEVAKRVISGAAQRGIVLCGTGIGISIAANKCEGIRAALCHDVYSARMSREHNDANVLAMGERVIGFGPAREVARAWLTTEFSEGERHVRRVGKIGALEA